ncbi:hypothetical protein [Tessaracoccus sp. OH4464_COT-324]|uniref:hypothetical protein n=1 Tax=Tessaracoccus sp. OH4464_COT-324 TaxID=2491059 RepID=UPI000F63F69D|nr:hypothetical protein [Tessaracoccus sp. OH4464_COT-324]RRD46947.1 hypothetical protein EII42_04420 [Tessaracoccus sp. OH4464_COT-324]
MRLPSMRALALTGAVAMFCGLAGCGAAESKQDTESSAVQSIDVMVEKLTKKSYDCKRWQRTDSVEGAAASGTCDGKDQIMWFESAEAVKTQIGKLDESGTSYVYGDNWIVANTKTPTFVRNALSGTAVAAKR